MEVREIGCEGVKRLMEGWRDCRRSGQTTGGLERLLNGWRGWWRGDAASGGVREESARWRDWLWRGGETDGREVEKLTEAWRV